MNKSLFLNSKKGLSTVVTTLIIILLVLVAAGIMWAVIQGLIEDTGGDVTTQTKCLNARVEIERLNCPTNLICDVTVKRIGTGTDVETARVSVANNNTGFVSGEDTTTTSFDVLDRIVVRATGTGNGIENSTQTEAKVSVALKLKDGNYCTEIERTIRIS